MMMSQIIVAALTVPGLAMNLDTRSNTFLSSGSLQETEFQAASGVSAELHETMQGLAMDLLTATPVEGTASVRDGMKAISEKMDLKTAVKAIKHNTLPADVQSLVMSTASGSHQGGFDETSMGKARVALNSLVEKAWVSLDDKIIECKEYQEMNRATFDQVVTDISRLVEYISDLTRVETEAQEEMKSADQQIRGVEDQLSRETTIYNSIYAKNTDELTRRQNDLDVFQFILTFTRCSDATSLLQSNISHTRICSIHGGERTMCFSDHHAQTQFNQMMSHTSRHDISQILSEVEAPVSHETQANSFLQWGQDPIEQAMAAPEPQPVAGDEPGPPGFVPAPFCCEAHGVACGPSGGGIMCSPDPPDCGLLHDKLSLMWGDYKDQVDELTMEMNKNAYLFEELKITLNDQIRLLTNSKARFAQMLAETRSNLAADRAEMMEKNMQKADVEKSFLRFMRKCCDRVKWIMFQDMCALIVVRNAVLEGSTECPGASIVDCDVANWVDGKCSVECDDSCPDRPDPSQVYECGGWQKLRRSVVVGPPDVCGLRCPAQERDSKCNQKRCPVDCGMSEWSGFSKCTAECEGGVRTQTRQVLRRPVNGGLECNTNTEVQACNTMSCDRDCHLASWTPWAPCSVACGTGFQTRRKHVLIPTRGYGKCPKESSPERLAEQECNTQTCIGDEICIAQQDLVIAIDGSGSVRDNGFGVIKNFALDLLAKYRSEYFGAQKMKIGLVEFGNGIIMEDGVSVSPAMNVHALSSDLSSVKTALEGMVQKKGFTNMAQAFALAETMYTSAGRKGAQPALLVITDGKPSFQFQTQELVEQLDDKGVQRFFAVVTTNNKALSLMKQYASAPWETNLLHIPGRAVLEADAGMWAEKALTLFCPLSMSPSLLTTREEEYGYIHVLDDGYCGGRGQLLGTHLSDVEACMTAARGASCQSALVGTWFRRGYCYCGEQEVDSALYSEWASLGGALPTCPGISTESMIYDFYALEPPQED